MTEDEAYALFLAWRWPDGRQCPHCGHQRSYEISTRRKFKCAAPDCRKQFSATVGTAFASRKMTFATIMRTLDAVDGGGASDLQRLLGCQYKTAYVALQKIKSKCPKDWVGYWQGVTP